MIIGIDIGTNCGWAVLLPDGSRRDSGVWHMGLRPATKSRPADHRAQRWLDMAANVRALLSTYRPAVVVYERPVGRSSDRGGRSTWLVHGGLLAQLEIVALELDNLPLVEVSPAEWKRAMVGSGNAGKPEYVAAANARHGLHMDVKREDEAAALLIAGAAIELGKVGVT